MVDERNARIRAHASNIRRYERLLETRLSDVERRFIERRLAEERSALEALSAGEPPHSIDFTDERAGDRGPVLFWTEARIVRTLRNAVARPALLFSKQWRSRCPGQR